MNRRLGQRPSNDDRLEIPKTVADLQEALDSLTLGTNPIPELMRELRQSCGIQPTIPIFVSFHPGIGPNRLAEVAEGLREERGVKEVYEPCASGETGRMLTVVVQEGMQRDIAVHIETLPGVLEAHVDKK